MMKGLQYTGSSALAAIDRMEEKVLALEAEAEATAQVLLSFASLARPVWIHIAQFLTEMKLFADWVLARPQENLTPVNH